MTSSRPRPFYATDEALRDFVSAALREDVGDGDFSSISSIEDKKQATARLLIKDDGIIAGVELAEIIFHQFDPRLTVSDSVRDGEPVRKGDVGFTVSGSARSILATERLVLNCLQRMSGIATYTNKLIQLVKGTGAQVTDTRKTTPNFRICEKWAVYIGGGRNHRFALYDMIMLKDNHVDLGGGIANALGNATRFTANSGRPLQIEVETRTLDEVKQALSAGGADIIMLDNMSPAMMREAVGLIAGKARIEASGNINEANIRQVAECGVDYVSIGALTHSVRSLDISLKVIRGSLSNWVSSKHVTFAVQIAGRTMIVRTKNYRLEKKDYIKFALGGVLRQQWWVSLIVVAICACYFLVPSIWWFIGALVGAGLYLLFWWIQFYGVTQLDQGKMLFERFSYEINSQQIIMKLNAREGMPMKWDQIKSARVGKDFFLLVVNKAQLIHLPFKIFNSDNERKFVLSILKTKKLTR